MGMSTERDGDFAYPAPGDTMPAYSTGGIIRGGHLFPPEERTVGPKQWGLEGFHRDSGGWVKLVKFDDEAVAEAAIIACHSKSQPDKKRISIVFEDFSAFRVESYVTVTWIK